MLMRYLFDWTASMMADADAGLIGISTRAYQGPAGLGAPLRRAV